MRGVRPLIGAGPGEDYDWGWTRDDPGWVPPEVDTSRPSPARMYDYALGGKDNFAVDRAAVAKIGEVLPDFAAVAQANRGFLTRSVRMLAEHGVRQFLDLGTGLPTSPNVHEIAQSVDPEARVVYVDNDPIVMAHNRALRVRHPNVVAVQHDLRDPASIVNDPLVRQTIDFDRPVAVLFIAVLHFVRRDLAPEIIARFAQEMSAGSFLAVSTGSRDGMAPSLVHHIEEVYSASAVQFVFRDRAQVEQLFEGFDLVDPGLVDVTGWRATGEPLPIRILSGVGRKHPG